MKTQDFGWSSYHGGSGTPRRDCTRGGRSSWEVGLSKKNYQQNRSNGGDEDSPARDLPLDGNCSDWIKCPGPYTLPRPLTDGSYKEGLTSRRHDGDYYRIRYQEGPSDKAWMEERDGNYLARLECEGQAVKAAELRALLPPTHPHYRPNTSAVSAPSVSPVPAAATGGASGSAAAPRHAPAPAPAPPASRAVAAPPTHAPDPLEAAFTAQAAGDHRQAIRLLDAYLHDHPGTVRAHKFRGFSKTQLAATVSSTAQKEALLKSAKTDYDVVLDAYPMDDEAGAAIDIINRQLAPSPVAAAGAGAGAAATPLPAMALFQAVGRVWGGKYAIGGTQPVYVAHAMKTEGCAIGAIYCKTPSKPGVSYAGKLWLGKVGFNQSERDERALRTHSLVRRGSSVDSIREKIAADTYALLSRGHYLVPKHRLAKLPVINEFTRENVLAQALVEEMNRGRADRTDTAVHLMSKWIEGYHNLDNAQVKNPDGSIGPIMTYIEAQHTVPERIIFEGQEVPLLGIMEILAAARLLGDTDVLGGGGKNAGFVIEREASGTPIAARAVKIDAGNAFNFQGAENRLFQSFNPMADEEWCSTNPCDIQFSNNQPFDLEWAKLTDGQRGTFLDALQNGLTVLQTPLAMRILINREGEFNRAEAGLLTEDVVTKLTKIWQTNITMHASDRLYGPMMAEISVGASLSL